MYQKQTIGRFGEKVACEYLEKNDYKILDRNFKCRQGEIDIIGYDEVSNEVVFFEDEFPDLIYQDDSFIGSCNYVKYDYNTNNIFGQDP